MRKLIVLLSLVAGINACKTAEMGTGSTLAAGRDTGFCPTFDFTKITDPIERERTVRFLVEMWLKGNARAGILLGAFLYNMSPEQFMREINAATKGELLADNASGRELTEKDVASIEIERRIQEKLMSPVLGAVDGLVLSKGPIDAALFKTGLADVARAAAQANKASAPSSEIDVEAQRAMDMIKASMDYETTLTEADVKGEGNVPTAGKVRNFARERKFVGMSAALEMMSAKLAVWGNNPKDTARVQTEVLLDGMKLAWIEHVREAARSQNANTYIATAQIWKNEMSAFLRGRDGQVDKEALDRTGIDRMIERMKNPAERQKLSLMSETEAKAEMERSLDFRGARDVMAKKGVELDRSAFERMRAGK
jgi:hypothetical protein